MVFALLFGAELDMIDRVANLGGLGVCVAILFYLIRSFQSEIDAERKRHDAAVRDARDSFHRMLMDVVTRHENDLKEKRSIFQASLDLIVKRHDEALAGLVEELKIVVDRVDRFDEKLDSVLLKR